MARLGYRPELDGLRALAVAAVIGYHAEFPGFEGGAVGVNWFFVLSGFLITTLLLEERERLGTVDVPRFFARRALRLLPSLYLVLGAFAVVSIWVWIDWREFASAGLYFANIHPLVFGPDAEQVFFLHTWSLSLEEQFYLVWPFVVLKLSGRASAVVLGAALVASAFVARMYAGDGYEVLTLPVFNFDGFVIGAFLAVAVRVGRGEGRASHPLVLAGAVLVMAFDVVVPADDIEGLLPVRVLLSQLAVAGFILFLVVRRDHPVPSLLRHRAFVYVGLLSYALYLWHFPVFELLTAERVPDLWRPARHVLKFGITIALAMFTYHVFDKPFHALRAKVRPGAPKRQPATAGAPPTGTG